jgi:hypothetical protein
VAVVGQIDLSHLLVCLKARDPGVPGSLDADTP